MKKIYTNLKSKIEKIKLSGSGKIRAAFYGILLGIFKYVIILTLEAGESFPLIYQTSGPRSVNFSYKQFKSYRKKVRFFSLIMLIIFAIIVFKLQKNG